MSDSAVAELMASLRSSEVGLHLWLETREAMCWIDLTGVVFAVNPAFCGILGYSSIELVGQSLTSITAREDIPYFLEGVATLREKQGTQYRMIQRYRTRIGTIIPARHRISSWSSGSLLFVQFLPVDLMTIDSLPEEEKKKVIQLLVGSWIIHNWKKILLLMSSVGGLANLDRIIGLIA